MSDNGVFAATVLIINVIMWLVFFFKYKKTYSPENVLKSIRVEVDKLFKDLELRAEEDVLLIEARIKGLRELIAKADERILLAEKELEKRENEKQVLADLEPAAQVSAPKTSEQRKLSRYEQTALGMGAPYQPSLIEEPAEVFGSEAVEVAVQQSLFDMPQESAPEPPSPIFASRESSPRDKIIELYGMNLSEDLIAERLAMPIGEVQLVLNLYKAQTSSLG